MRFFPKMLVHCGQKIENLPSFIFGKRGHESVFDHIPERKKTFLDYKNKELNKSKTWDFVSPWFRSKN